MRQPKNSSPRFDCILSQVLTPGPVHRSTARPISRADPPSSLVAANRLPRVYTRAWYLPTTTSGIHVDRSVTGRQSSTAYNLEITPVRYLGRRCGGCSVREDPDGAGQLFESRTRFSTFNKQSKSTSHEPTESPSFPGVFVNESKPERHYIL